MRKLALLAIFLALPVLASAQYSGNGVPNLTCGANIGNAAYHNSVNGANYTCQLFNGIWQWRVTPSVPGGIAGDSFAVDITQPPYNAKCDGHTDDHVAIQAALDQNAAIQIPIGPQAPTECMTGTVGLTFCSASNPFGYNAFYGNGQILGYSGSGTAIHTTSNCQGARIQDLQLDATAATGSPVMYQLDGTSVLDNLYDNLTLPAGTYTAINITAAQTFVSGFFDNTGKVNISGSNPDGITIRGADVDSINSTTGQFSLIDDSVENTGGDTSVLTGATYSIVGGAFVGSVEFGGLGHISGTQLISTNTVDNGANLSGDVALSMVEPTFTFTGSAYGRISVFDVASTPYVTDIYLNGIQTNTLYSVAGTPLPTCGASTTGVQLQVSDATIPTFLGTYTGGSTVRSPVVCNGTNWVTY